MKTLMSIVAIAMLLSTNGLPVFAQYGGGGGGSTSSLVRDVCPDGDTSGSYYDGICGDVVVETTPTVLLETGSPKITDPYSCEAAQIYGNVQAEDLSDVVVRVVLDGPTKYTFTPSITSNGDYVVSTRGVADGLYTVTYSVTDGQGNSDAHSYTANIRSQCSVAAPIVEEKEEDVSLYDILKKQEDERQSDTPTTSVPAPSGKLSGQGGFVLPGMLAPTGASL